MSLLKNIHIRLLKIVYQCIKMCVSCLLEIMYRLLKIMYHFVLEKKKEKKKLVQSRHIISSIIYCRYMSLYLVSSLLHNSYFTESHKLNYLPKLHNHTTTFSLFHATHSLFSHERSHCVVGLAHTLQFINTT